MSSFLRKIVGRSDEEWDHVARVTRLATYNAEVARGIIHTEEWRLFMLQEQKWWNVAGQYREETK